MLEKSMKQYIFRNYNNIMSVVQYNKFDEASSSPQVHHHVRICDDKEKFTTTRLCYTTCIGNIEFVSHMYPVSTATSATDDNHGNTLPASQAK